MADAKKIEELRAKFGPDVTILETAGEIVIIRKPSRMEYARFRQLLLSEDARQKSTANEVLASGSMVWPEGMVEREAVFDRAPAIIDTIASEAARLAGAGAEAKKL